MSVNGAFFPFIYALMPNKEEDSYKKVFRFVKQKFPDLSIKNLIVDFEQATGNAALAVFPECRIRYCVFHYSQAIYKNLFGEGLKQIYI